MMKLKPKISIKIIDEYRALVPAQSDHEYQGLKQSIKEDGFWDSHPIVINTEGIILDGHHRYRACQELAFEPKTTFMHFRDKLQEKLFVINSNLKRRHLNSFQRIELALRSKSILQEIARTNESLGGKGVQIKTPLGRVNDEIGRRVGAGKETVRKVELILKIAPIELLNKLRSDSESIDSAYNNIIREERRREIINRANGLTNAIADHKRYQLINSDIRKLGVKEIADNSVNLMFTDPPYPKKYLPLYDDLAKLAYRTLVPGGSLITYLRQYDIPTIFRYMENAGLTYNWLIGVELAGPFSRAHPKNIVIKFKPLAWYTKGKIQINRPSILESFDDLIKSRTPSESKKIDKWAQDNKEASEIIRKLTLPNDTVLDPMMGMYCTTGKAALKLKRKFIGVEINSGNFEIAEANLANEI